MRTGELAPAERPALVAKVPPGMRGSEAAGVLLGQPLGLEITPHSYLCPSPSQESLKLSKPRGIQFSALEKLASGGP